MYVRNQQHFLTGLCLASVKHATDKRKPSHNTVVQSKDYFRD